MTDWHVLGAVEPEKLADARLQLHHGVQLLAAFGGTHVSARDDDSHRALTWDAQGERFLSEPAEDGVQVTLVLHPFELTVERGGASASGLRLLGTTLGTARAWLAKAVAKVRGDDEEPLKWPEYDLPDHGVLSGRPFQPRPAALRELARWYTNTQALLEQFGDQADDLSVQRTWPHHFDLAVLWTLQTDDEGAATRTVGVGVSPGDDDIDQPYLYVNAWPDPGADAFSDIEAPGQVQTEGWRGYTLTATDLLAHASQGRPTPDQVRDRQRDAALGFVTDATAAARAALEENDE